MPRGAKPGQGRGGRPPGSKNRKTLQCREARNQAGDAADGHPGSKNRKTLLKQAALAAAAADPNISPKDVLMRRRCPRCADIPDKRAVALGGVPPPAR